MLQLQVASIAFSSKSCMPTGLGPKRRAKLLASFHGTGRTSNQVSNRVQTRSVGTSTRKLCDGLPRGSEHFEAQVKNEVIRKREHSELLARLTKQRVKIRGLVSHTGLGDRTVVRQQLGSYTTVTG